MAFTVHDYDRILKECILSHSKWVLVIDEYGDIQLKDVFNLTIGTTYIDVEGDDWILYKVSHQEDDEYLGRFDMLKIAVKEIKQYV